MLRKFHDLVECTLRGRDGLIGRVRDCAVAELHWKIHFLVVASESTQEIALVPVETVRESSGAACFDVDLTADALDWRSITAPAELSQPPGGIAIDQPSESPQIIPHLRVGRELLGRHLDGVDGRIGHVSDLLIEPADWGVHYLVIDTGRWLPGRLALVSPWWTHSRESGDAPLASELTRDFVQHSPRYNPREPLTLSQIEAWQEHYARAGRAAARHAPVS